MGLKLAGAGAGGRYVLTQNADINVTPFVDVMLVILIIFMVAIPATMTNVKLDLPQAGARPAEARPRAPLVLSVQAGGGVFVGDIPSGLASLEADVSRELSRRGETREQARIHIRADRKIPYGEFVGVMDVLQTAGFQHVGLVAEKL